MYQLGGHSIFLGGANIQLGKRETVPDAARNLERWVHGIAARTFAHKTVIDLAKYADIPVINALSDQEHPCQALACVMTVAEKRTELSGLNMVFVGDGSSEKSHNAITGELINGSLIPMDFIHQNPKAAVHDLVNFLRIELLRYCSKIGHISE